MRIALPSAVGLALLLLTAAAESADPEKVLFEGTWTNGGYSIAGGWRIVEEGEARFVILDDEFATRQAPDLKIFLSPLPLDEIGNRNATTGSLLVAALERHSGAQRYPLALDVDLGAFRSIVMHCQRFSKFWGGATLERDAGRPSKAGSEGA